MKNPEFPKQTFVGEPISSLELKSVGYSYDGYFDVLQEINLKIEVGKKIGIIGVSGSGRAHFWI